ncbi:ZIP family metal transporter [Natranaerofaba carboxydovora]|uniref:ZIP family metal transporter n=1 Tax=Natranaerofaba carboxydovora TaxID=2742683 RepID=UPI001F141121|nr:ZIP family metal transporter [Natranaerofaba carboxydovora]UMZ75240.1 Zinc transporter ZupT [Natranaerofaba carboxydovora]
MEGILYSTLAGFSTVLGAIIVLSFGRPKGKTLAFLLGFAAGIMLAISTFELMREALEFSTAILSVIGFIFGAGILHFLNLFIPHMHLTEESKNNNILKVGYLVLLGIALHNFPEGMAIGAGLEASPELGLFIAISIGIHNVPEGMATAGPLKAGGLGNLRIILFTLFAGLMAPLGTITSIAIFGISAKLVGMGLAFAAGAMLYIVFHELIPEGHKFDTSFANIGLLIGFLLGYILF